MLRRQSALISPFLACLTVCITVSVIGKDAAGNWQTEASATTASWTVDTTVGNGATIPAVGVHVYSEGRVVTITATPASGWRFDSWTGDLGAVADPVADSTTITMDADYAISANFAVPIYPGVGSQWVYIRCPFDLIVAVGT